MIRAGLNCVFGEGAFSDIDLTAPANAPPAADRIEIDAERARGGQQARPIGELTALSGRREDDAMHAQSRMLMPSRAGGPRGARRRPRPPLPPPRARDICEIQAPQLGSWPITTSAPRIA